MLSIIIINYHSVSLIKDCIQSIKTNTKDILFEIIIVDNNGVPSDDLQTLKKLFPEISCYDMGYNAGFARANNLGISKANGDSVLLLNPDTIIQDNVLSNVYNRFSISNYVACGVQLLNEDASPQISGNYIMKGGLNYLLPLPFLGDFMKWLGETINVKRPSDKNIAVEKKVDWINGAFLMVKKSAIAKVGVLDEDFFLYAEETEWCSRLRRVGSLIIYGDEHIIHLQGETANKSFNSEDKGYYNLYDKKGRQIIVSNFLRIRKEFGMFWFLVMLFFYTIEVPIFFVLGLLSILIGKIRGKIFWKNWKGYTYNIGYLWSMFGKMTRNKPYFYKVN